MRSRQKIAYTGRRTREKNEEHKKERRVAHEEEDKNEDRSG